MPADQAFNLPDSLTMAEVPDIHRSSQNAFRSGQFPDRIDLAGLRRTDSSGLALLLEWQAQARAHGRQIEFTNPPQSLLVLARLSQAGQLLGWDAQTADYEP